MDVPGTRATQTPSSPPPYPGSRTSWRLGFWGTHSPGVAGPAVIVAGEDEAVSVAGLLGSERLRWDAQLVEAVPVLDGCQARREGVIEAVSAGAVTLGLGQVYSPLSLHPTPKRVGWVPRVGLLPI